MWVGSRVSSALSREGSAAVESNEGKREMRWLPAVGGVLLIVCAVLAAFGLAARRASRDWSYQLHVVRVLGLLAGLDSPGEALDLFEVVLVEPNLSPGSFTLAFSAVYRPQDVGLLELDVPLGELAERCAMWRDAATPLLFSGDVAGEAVLHGPDGCLVGRVETWREPVPIASERQW